jgi:Carboxypeptidase regulatory-like domain
MTTLNRMIRLLPSMMLVTVATICSGQVSAVPQRASPSQTVSGQVINSITGEPIARARVQVGAQRAALTDHDGHFEFEDMSEEPAYAFASKPGYFAEDKAVPAQGQSITLKLIPEAVLFGTITDENGQPIQDLPVQLTMLRVENGLRRWRPMQGTTTNVEGQFRFAELQAGQYSLSTGFRIEGLVDAPSSVAFMPVNFPPLTGDEIRGAVTLKAGDQVEANASPATEKLYPVTGTINGIADGGGANVTVETKDGEAIDSPVNNYPGGRFRLRLPSGSYRLKAHSVVEHERWLAGTREISVSEAPLQGVSVTLQPPPILPIEVEYQAVTAASQNAPGGPPAYLNAWLQDQSPRGLGQVFSAQPLKPPGPGRALEAGDPMVFRDLEPGRYELEAQPQPPWYVASASCGNLDLTRDPLMIGTGTGACTVRMVYRDDSASLKWLASPGEDGNGAGNQVFVMAIPLDNVTQPAVETTIIPDHPLSSDSPAEGSFEGLAPGRYLVMALPQRQQLPYRDREALQRFMPLGQEITLTRGGKSEVQLKIVTGEP